MPSRTLTEESRLLNRELSWIEFNARVLDLVADETSRCSSASSSAPSSRTNLDEFFQVRVAGLMGQAEAGFAVRSADGLSPPPRARGDQEARLRADGAPGEAVEARAPPALAAEGIEVVTVEECTSKELKRSRRGSPATSTPC